MCIRDSSLHRRHVGIRHARQNRLEAVDKQAVRTNLVQGRICLLYTSDAADDLRCVDLGGRRIIKKKKKRKQKEKKNYLDLHKFMRTPSDN